MQELTYLLDTTLGNWMIRVGNISFVHAEFEYLKGNGTYTDDFTGSFDFDTTNETIFTGIGYRYPVGKKLALQTSLLYRINHQADTPYDRLVFRLGVEF